MGCGKTTIAKYLSKKLNLNHIDLDQKIEIIYNMKISEIFELEGELRFRKIENKTLINVLKFSNKSVISLGGGTPCYFNNMSLINQNSKYIFYIKNSNETLSQRLYKEKKTRPIISHFNSLKTLKVFVSKHMFERAYFYNMANYKINAEEKKVDQIVNYIIEEINR